MRLLSLASLASLTLLATACSTAPAAESDAGIDGSPFGEDVGARPDAASTTGTITIGPTERPARLIAPPTVTEPAALLVLLHGYGATGAVQDTYLGVSRAAATRNMYVLIPDGTVDASGKRYWQGTPGCCDFAHSGVDDVAYLSGLVHEAIAMRPIDPNRVYFFGHSNGGFMTYRLACQFASETAAVAILAGSDFPGEMDCVPSRPVPVLHLHGTGDTTIPYAGGNVGLGAFPGATTVAARWAMRAGCDATPTMGAPIDMESTIAGAETTPTTYTGCGPGLDVRLLTMEGASHIPTFTSGMIGTEVLDWLLAHHL